MQATLANLPMDQVQSTYSKSDPAYADNMRWAEDALVTAVFCIIICGAWGTLSIRYLSPFLLEKACTSGQTHLSSSSCMTEASVSRQMGSLSYSCRESSTWACKCSSSRESMHRSRISLLLPVLASSAERPIVRRCSLTTQVLAAGVRGR